MNVPEQEYINTIFYDSFYDYFMSKSSAEKKDIINVLRINDIYSDSCTEIQRVYTEDNLEVLCTKRTNIIADFESYFETYINER